MTDAEKSKRVIDENFKAVFDILQGIDLAIHDCYVPADRAMQRAVQDKLAEAWNAIVNAQEQFYKDQVEHYGLKEFSKLPESYPGIFALGKFNDYEFIPRECLRPLDDVLSLTEASALYKVPKPTLQSACTGQKGYPPLFTDRECRKAGSTWLVTRAAMERVYGKN